MLADQLRNRTVGSKMTESEYEQLVAVAERAGLTLGEWCREVLLAHANWGDSKKPSTTEQTLLAEFVALRMILLNALSRLGRKVELSERDLQELAELADQERFQRAQERLAAAVAGGRS
jgi:mobilization protein NikA